MIKSIKDRLLDTSKKNAIEIQKLEAAAPHYSALQTGLSHIINTSIDQIQKLDVQEQPQAILQLVQAIPRFISQEEKKVVHKIIATRGENTSIKKTLQIINDEIKKHDRIKEKIDLGEITPKKSRSKIGNRPEKIRDIRTVAKKDKK
jgi:hypothetical protein